MSSFNNLCDVFIFRENSSEELDERFMGWQKSIIIPFKRHLISSNEVNHRKECFLVFIWELFWFSNEILHVLNILDNRSKNLYTWGRGKKNKQKVLKWIQIESWKIIVIWQDKITNVITLLQVTTSLTKKIIAYSWSLMMCRRKSVDELEYSMSWTCFGFAFKCLCIC